MELRRPYLSLIAILALLIAAVVAAVWVSWSPPVVAAVPPPDSACIMCHVGNEAEIVLPSGEVIPVGIDLTVLESSVHGTHAAADVNCTDCHRGRERYLYPHEPNPAETYHEFRSEISQNCEQCHMPLERHNPGHLLAEDTAGLPTCTDCHGGHDVAPVETWASDPIATCQTCHTDFGDDPVIQALHENVVPNLGEDQSCRTCHADAPPPTADGDCKTCHSLLEGTLTLASGDELPLNVHADEILNSVHGDREIQGVAYPALQCTDCHDMEHYTFPHPPVESESAREFTIAHEAVCADCHEGIFELNHTSVHAIALAEGNLDAASCVDCHGAHNIQPPDEPRERISQTCAQCHATIHDQYAQSVHGAALLGEQNPDVPVCTNCHGAHDITDPTTAQFRLQSPQLCAECHADVDMMAKYNISTDVFDTYVADFHGTTVTLFEKTSPDQETNSAVCYDCHGVHNILPATDENSQVLKDNLLATCRQCHPDANTNFPDAWMSHYEPSLEHYPAVYLINLFYRVLIPAVVGGFVLFIGSDVVRRVVDRRKSRKGSEDE